MDIKYNGYKNKETWTMALYLGDMVDWAGECESVEELKESLSYIITEEVTEIEGTIPEPLYALLKVALAKVNWYEIADTIFEDYDEDDFDEERYDIDGYDGEE